MREFPIRSESATSFMVCGWNVQVGAILVVRTVVGPMCQVS